MSTSPLPRPDRRAAADQNQDQDQDQEPGPAHSEAALALFLGQVERAIAARVDARLAAANLVPVPVRGPAAAPAPGRRDQSPAVRRIIRDAVAVSGGALLVAAIVGLHGSDTRQFGPVPGRIELPHVRFGPGQPGQQRIVLLPATFPQHGVRHGPGFRP